MEVKLLCQKGTDWADPGGHLMPTRIYSSSENRNLSDSDIIDVVKSYSTFLRHSETEIRFSEFLTTELNNKFFKLFGIKARGRLQGMYIEDKDHLKKIIQDHIPEDLKWKYRRINEGESVSYIPRTEFSLIRAEQITELMKESNDLEQRLEFEKQMEEFYEPAPIDPREVELIERYIKSYSVEEAIGKFGEYKVTEVLPDELL